MNPSIARASASGALVLGLLLASVPAAEASFHLIKVREVQGSAPEVDRAFVELQMYAAGQQYVDGHDLHIYGPDPDPENDGFLDPIEFCDIATVLPNGSMNGEEQRTVLVGDSDVSLRDASCSDPAALDVLKTGGAAAASGAICFTEGSPPDCVSWGSFEGAPATAGFDNALPFGGALPSGLQSLKRDISGGSCATALDLGDDTNDANADFAQVPLDPTPNSVVPVEVPCMTQPQLGGGGSTDPGTIQSRPKKCRKGQKRVKGKCRKKKRKKR